MRRSWLAGALAFFWVAASSGPARAGTYEVISCGAAQGVNHAWQSFNESPATLKTGASCSAINGGDEDGLFGVDRLPGPPDTPKDGVAGWRVTAPPGIQISRLTVQYYLGQDSAGEWFPFIQTGEGNVLETCQPPGGDPECERGDPTYDPLGPTWTYAVGTQRIEAGVRCLATMGGCVNGASLHAAWVALYSARVQITDSVPPTMPQPAPASTAPPSYVRGTQRFMVSATDTTGITRTQLQVDDVPRSTITRSCDYTYVVPCTNEPGATHTLDTHILADGTHTIRQVAVDAADNESSRSSTISVDNTPPSAPLDLAVEYPAGPRSTRFSARWRNPAGQVAPIAAAHWSLCRPNSQDCVSGERRADGADATGDQTAPTGGAWDLRVWLEDAAGNVDPGMAAGPLRLSLKAPKPGLKIRRVRRRGDLLTVSGTTTASTGRLLVSVERTLRGRLRRSRGAVRIRQGRWVRRLRLHGRLAKVHRAKLVVHFAAQHGYAAQTLARGVRR